MEESFSRSDVTGTGGRIRLDEFYNKLQNDYKEFFGFKHEQSRNKKKNKSCCNEPYF